jgi:hypothetical protein
VIHHSSKRERNGTRLSDTASNRPQQPRPTSTRSCSSRAQRPETEANREAVALDWVSEPRGSVPAGFVASYPCVWRGQCRAYSPPRELPDIMMSIKSRDDGRDVAKWEARRCSQVSFYLYRDTDSVRERTAFWWYVPSHLEKLSATSERHGHDSYHDCRAWAWEKPA